MGDFLPTPTPSAQEREHEKGKGKEKLTKKDRKQQKEKGKKSKKAGKAKKRCLKKEKVEETSRFQSFEEEDDFPLGPLISSLRTNSESGRQLEQKMSFRVSPTISAPLLFSLRREGEEKRKRGVKICTRELPDDPSGGFTDSRNSTDSPALSSPSNSSSTVQEDGEGKSPLGFSFSSLCSSTSALSLLLSHVKGGNSHLMREELTFYLLVLTEYCELSSLLLFQSLITLDSHLFDFPPSSNSLALSFANSVLFSECHSYLHSTLGTFLLSIQHNYFAPSPKLQATTDHNEFFQPQNRQFLVKTYLDFLDIVSCSLLEMSQTPLKMFSLLSRTAKEREIPNGQSIVEWIVKDLFFSQFLAHSLENCEIFSFNGCPGIRTLASLLAIMLRDGFRGKLGWFNSDRKFLEIVGEKILLIERFLVKKKSLREEDVEQLQEIYIQFMLLWEDSHHECKRERGKRTCQEFEITPREAALGLVECVDGVVKKKGNKREACETLRKVSNLLSHEVAQF